MAAETTGTTRWGILGPGGIARKFATGLKDAEGAELVAVGSRTQEGADRFGDEFGVPHRHASYEALVADPDVDVIYVAVPHPFHREAVLLCLEAGKHVLCEKPFTVNAAEAAELIAAARERGLFLMEAMWSRYVPAIVRFRELIAEGAIGEPRLLEADFGFRAGVNPEGRLFKRELGGGALLDVGVYVVSLASLVFGEPAEAVGRATIGETGVDEQTAIILTYPGGQIAQLSCAIRTGTRVQATLFGTAGSLTIESPWYIPDTLTLRRDGQAPETISVPYTGNGYNYEAEEAGRRIAAGETESPVMPLDETHTIIATLDRLREPWGLRYPSDDRA
jgi:predicted dehydrogenase